MSEQFEMRPVRAEILPHEVDLIGVYGKIDGKMQLLATAGTWNHCGAVETANLFVASPLLYEALEECRKELEQLQRLSHGKKQFPDTKGMEMADNALRAARGDE